MQRRDRAENLLLALLDGEARAALGLEPVELAARDVVHESGMPVLHAYFPRSAVLSLVSTMESGASAEVALVGREGMLGLDGVLGAVEGRNTAVVQVSGTADRTPIARLKALRPTSPSVRRMLDLYTEARFIQVAQTAACNRLHSVEERLARWLLAVRDRIQGDTFTLSQEFIGQMLGVHRPTVSTTLRRFQERGVIEYRARAIAITDAAGLEAIACECYRVIQREFERVLKTGVSEPERVSSGAALRVRDSEPTAPLAVETMREIAGRLLLATIREREAREQAEAAIRAKDQFFAMLSHELRTPLNAILGWCTILAGRNDPAHARGLGAIERNAKAQLRLVEDLLDTVRLASATIVIEPSPLNIAELVREVVESLKPAADAKHIALRTSVADHLPPLAADPARLRQVLLNVVANALKFTDEGAIEITVAAVPGATRICVKDSGRGIASDVLPHVFERFRQGAVAPGGPGLGLGLTIARTIVELHGGTIQLASAGEGQGTTCTITLPVAAG